MRLAKNISKDNGRAIDFIEITMRQDFKDAVKKLRHKWNIDTDFLSGDSEEASTEWLRFLENNELREDVKDLLAFLSLSLSWLGVAHMYIVDDNFYSYNDTSHWITSNPLGLVLEQDLENPDNIILRVGAETAWPDFKIAWEEIKKIRGIVTPRKRERKLFLRDYEIFSLAKNGKTIPEICTTIEDKYGKSKDLDYGNIKKIVSDFYTRLKISKEERVTLKTR